MRFNNIPKIRERLIKLWGQVFTKAQCPIPSGATAENNKRCYNEFY